MRIIDISQSLEESMAYYPSLKKFQLQWRRSFENGSGMSLSEVQMASHVGTHLDAPLHYIENGKNINEIDLAFFFGEAMVIEVDPAQNVINLDMLKRYKELPERVLIKTKNSGLYKEKIFCKNYVSFDTEAALYLVQKLVKLVGIDYVSVDPYKAPEKSVHKAFLSQGVVLLEGIDLCDVSEGNYQLICFPLKVKGAEAAPCRAVLIEN